ncbi:MAG: LOG family protein, partial [Acetobacteraceae bacterium]|nr:LOG family protein [Acetobacteraceae bacterium]
RAPNAYSTPALTFRFHYFAMRKMHLAMRARALAVFPGGFGTLDELFEILTLMQTRKAPPAGVVLFGRDWWSRVVDWEMLAANGMVDAADLGLFRMVDAPEEAWEWLLERGLALPAEGDASPP